MIILDIYIYRFFDIFIRDGEMTKASLESLLESEEAGLEIINPGGLALTDELAELCHISKDSSVLDVASGTGESACHLAEKYNCKVTGVDVSDYMLAQAERKALDRGLKMEFKNGSAHDLPFDDESFDAVISECTTCLLDRGKGIKEMARVAKSGGYVGIHDLCWQGDVPDGVRRRLSELEDARPETLDGWRRLFEDASLVDVVTIDKSNLMREWPRRLKEKWGISGQLKLFLKVLRDWGVNGLKTVRESEGIYRSGHVGYGIIVGRKPKC